MLGSALECAQVAWGCSSCDAVLPPALVRTPVPMDHPFGIFSQISLARSDTTA